MYERNRDDRREATRVRRGQSYVDDWHHDDGGSKDRRGKKEGEDYRAHFGGLASAGVLVDTPITFVAKISEDNYNKLRKNVKDRRLRGQELADNYDLKGIIYTAIAMSDSTTDGKYIYFNGHDIPWTMNSAGFVQLQFVACLLERHRAIHLLMAKEPPRVAPFSYKKTARNRF